VIPNGIDLSGFQGANGNKIRREFNMPAKSRIILFVGRLVKVKGLKYLFSAMPWIVKASPNTKLLIVGDGPIRQELESQAKALQAELAELSQDQKIYNLRPEFDLYKVEELIPLENAVSQLRENSRILNSIRINLRKLEYARKGYEENIKPDLSLVAQFNTKRIDETFGKALEMDKPDALVGVQLSFPLDNLTSKSQVKTTNLQIAQLKKQLEEISLGLVSTLTNLHIQIVEMEKVLVLNQEQIESAREKTKEELKLYNQGRGSLTFVIQSRDSEQNAKLNYAQNALTYHKLLLQYHALMDQFL